MTTGPSPLADGDVCPWCAGIGWLLVYASPPGGALALSLVPCSFQGGCPTSGAPIASLDLGGRFSRAVTHGPTRTIASVTGFHSPTTERPAAARSTPTARSLPAGYHGGMP